ncbi:Metallo-dependent phosphatase-like protein [Lasiosphaeris hirsuta]|uniref:Metallo-dependent phosphatase-like protein n=1 Tax=Lasiosphaeris hirsuta TaxID=260670 RepID=A0AA40APX7_9PEZI|nr:Metallo-dependent phosphatase-like protein [Lasiosphaeris hirsuta]
MDTTSPSAPSTRRTRFVCISDTHSSTVKLPKGDVLIHAGDLTNQGSYSELSKAMQWLEKADLRPRLSLQYGPQFHNKVSQGFAKCISLLSSSSTVTYLCHGSTTIRLCNPSVPRTKFTVFGSPYSPRTGLWAFGYDRPDAATDTPDILITHTPPYTHRDCDPLTGVLLGCESLQRTLWRVRPRLHVCGHIHPGRGAERVRWNPSKPGNTITSCWEDPAPDSKSSKMSLTNLTARYGNQSLDYSERYEPHATGSHPISPTTPPGKFQPSGPNDRVERKSLSEASNPSSVTPAAGTELATNTSGPAADEGRMGRRETCIVNCAIMATNWPHERGKKLSKPIVVDLDLPVQR